MARTKTGILGNLNGSIGNFTMYNLNRQPVIRRKAIDIYNPQSPAQTKIRRPTAFIVSAYKQLKELLLIIIPAFPKKYTLNSFFLKINYSAIQSQLDNDIFILTFSKHNYYSPQVNFEGSESSQGFNYLHFEFDRIEEPDQFSPNKFYIVLHKVDDDTFTFFEGSDPQQDNEYYLEIPVTNSTTIYKVYFLFFSPVLKSVLAPSIFDFTTIYTEN